MADEHSNKSNILVIGRAVRYRENNRDKYNTVSKSLQKTDKSVFKEFVVVLKMR